MATEAILLSVAMAVAAGLVGSFAVMRRMALAADALSHVALPGIGIALALHVHPLVGAVAMLFFGALLVWALEERSRATTETVIGVVFSAALALGSLMTTGEDLIEALFGGAGVLNSAEIAFGFVAAGAVVAFMITQRNRLIVMLVSPDVARTAGIDVQQLNLLYLQVFALTIALGLRYLGVLLMRATDEASLAGRGHHLGIQPLDVFPPTEGRSRIHDGGGARRHAEANGLAE